MLCCKDQISFAKIVELCDPASCCHWGTKKPFFLLITKKTFAVPFELQRRCVTPAEYNAHISPRTYKKWEMWTFPKKTDDKIPRMPWLMVLHHIWPFFSTFVSYFISLSSSCNGNCLFDEIKIKGRGEREKKKRAGHGRSCRSSSHGLRNSGAYLPNDSINWTK